MDSTSAAATRASASSGSSFRASAASSAMSSVISSIASSSLASKSATGTSRSISLTSSEALPIPTGPRAPPPTQRYQGITLLSFLSALIGAIVVFTIQVGIFLLLRNKLARIFKPKTYLVPERERTESPPASPWGMLKRLLKVRDREIINKCGLDAYFFLRYLQTLLIIFIPVTLLVVPILVPINFVGGFGGDLFGNATSHSTVNVESKNVTGLDTLAWSNVKPRHARRYTVHLILAIAVICWVCTVFFFEMRAYIKIRQDYLTTAEHRLRASATTVLVNSIPKKWLSEKALIGLFDVFPGGVRNVWLTRDFTELLQKINLRNEIHDLLENAETELIRKAKRRQLKQRAKEEKISRSERGKREQQEDNLAREKAVKGGGVSSGGQRVPHDANEIARDDIRRMSRQNVPTLSTLGHVEQDIEASGLAKARRNRLDGGKFELGVGFIHAAAGRGVGDGPRSPRSRLAPYSTLQRKTSGNSWHNPTAAPGNTVRKVVNLEDMYVNEERSWWQFWKPPAGGFASPIPQTEDNSGYPFPKTEDGHTGETVKETTQKNPAKKQTFFSSFHVFTSPALEPVEYPKVGNFDDPGDVDQDAVWRQWLKPSDRPTHLARRFNWTPSWLPGLPFINKRVDTIYWARKELARLNMEIEFDQKNWDRYPIMNSAFVQFNHQVSAHMACQSLTHHIPKQMAPRIVEISPSDVIWDNMAINWWQSWIRTTIVTAVIVTMIVLWSFPVVWSSSLSNLNSLIKIAHWLSFLDKDEQVRKIANAAAGILPALFLALFLLIVPLIFEFIAGLQGVKTGAQRSELVQIYYFLFLFVQVFLVISVSSFAFNSADDFIRLGSDVSKYPEILAQNIPSAANYFFSYMILQALSTSSGTLLQIGTLFFWYVVARIFDNTARAKWKRNTMLPNVSWGSFFPVYTNFACIALVYSIPAPIICIFAIITFSLLWVAQRYNMLYVTRFANDTGGVLYPRAINQTFTGLYVMELCLVGLFFLVKDEQDKNICYPHGIVMIISFCMTGLFQITLNRSFGPLLRYLPITFEDEAVIRDEAFQRAQDRRMGLESRNGNSFEERESSDEQDASRLLQTPTRKNVEVHGQGSGSKHGAGDSKTINVGDRPLSETTVLGNDASEHSPNSSKGLHAVASNTTGTTSDLDGEDIDGAQAKAEEALAGAIASGTGDAEVSEAAAQSHENDIVPRRMSTRVAKHLLIDKSIDGLLRGGHKVKHMALGPRSHDGNGGGGGTLRVVTTAAEYRRMRRQKDLEAQRAMGEALFGGGYRDEIEDLRPEERDVLVRHAFLHYALRARRPVVWIPQDDGLGISEDEVLRTKAYGGDHIWISNEGTALDSKVRVVYGINPPDFSDVDLISL